MDELTSSDQVPLVATIEEMVAELNLAQIQFYELGIIYEDGHVSDGQPTDVKVEIVTSIRRQDDGIDFRARFTLPYPSGQVVVDAAAQYNSAGPRIFDEDATYEFADNIALMTLFPYIRQAVNDLGIRVGSPIVLPILPRGAFSFRNTSVPDQAVDEG